MYWIRTPVHDDISTVFYFSQGAGRISIIKNSKTKVREKTATIDIMLFIFEKFMAVYLNSVFKLREDCFQNHVVPAPDYMIV